MSQHSCSQHIPQFTTLCARLQDMLDCENTSVLPVDVPRPCNTIHEAHLIQLTLAKQGEMSTAYGFRIYGVYLNRRNVRFSGRAGYVSDFLGLSCNLLMGPGRR